MLKIGNRLAVQCARNSLSSYWMTLNKAITAKVITNDIVNLEWFGNQAVSIERSTNGVDYTELTTIAKGTTNFADKTVVSGSTYYYRIRAYIGTIYSGYSNTVNVIFTSLPKGLVSYWKLNEISGNALDSKSTHNGTLSNVTQQVTGAVFSKVTGSYIDCGAVTGVTVNSYTLLAKRNTLDASTNIMSFKGNYGGVQIGENGDIRIFTSAGVAAGVWAGIWTDKTAFHRITIVNSVIGGAGVGKTTLYFDGVSQGEQTVITEAPIRFVIGKAFANGNYDYGKSFDGTIKEVGFWNTALTQAKVTELTINRTYPFGSDSHGVWNVYGNVLSEYIPSDETTLMEPNIMRESGAQILSGTVFKAWFTAGWSNPAINYAESYDGKAWLRYANNPLTVNGRCRSYTMKVENTYYHFIKNTISGAIDLYTSTNGINLTLDTANVLVKGTAGAWDELAIENMSVIIEGGTWYMFYDGRTTSPNYYRTGLATSPDGRVWTKYGVNPIINELFNGGAAEVKKIGTSFYLWVLGGAGSNLPTDLIYRYKSADLLTWARDTDNFVFIRSTADEGGGTAIGQVADPFLIEYNNKVYLYYSASSDGRVKEGNLHLKLAIANMTFADLVLTQEGRV